MSLFIRRLYHGNSRHLSYNINDVIVRSLEKKDPSFAEITLSSKEWKINHTRSLDNYGVNKISFQMEFKDAISVINSVKCINTITGINSIMTEFEKNVNNPSIQLVECINSLKKLKI